MNYKYVVKSKQCDGCFAPAYSSPHWYCNIQPVENLAKHKAEPIDKYMFSSKGCAKWCPLVKDE